MSSSAENVGSPPVRGFDPPAPRIMRWLIVEDSLESRTGHWYEYLEGFHRELPRLGDAVTILASRRAGFFIQEQLGALPLLPEAAYLKMSDGASRLQRCARIPIHAWRTHAALKRFLVSHPPYDIAFVPTVLVHHLLGWTLIAKRALRRSPTRVLLFFPGLPIRRTAGAAVLDGSPTSRLMGRLLRSLRTEVVTGKVILGVETRAMQHAAETAFGLPFAYFPHPVLAPCDAAPACADTLPTNLTFACYGPARHEKGSDVLVSAIQTHLERFPDSHVRFALQWVQDFALPGGEMARLPGMLRQHPRVEIIDRFFGDGEYRRRLSSTQALLLPYRSDSYGLRLSRVAIEAMVYGTPFVATEGTTLWDQAGEFGAALACRDGDVESLTGAIRGLELNYAALRLQAEMRREEARAHFSVSAFRETFRRRLLECEGRGILTNQGDGICGTEDAQ